MSVHYGEAYVLACLPHRYLFPIERGMSVVISAGRESARGVISEILSVTDALPKEFQHTFKPSDRNQLAKIKFKRSATFPINQ